MPVGHGGDESKHPAWVKLAILKFIEKRFKNIILEEYDYHINEIVLNAFHEWIKRLQNAGIQEEIMNNLKNLPMDDIRKIMAERIIKVYDPITTENDFYIFFDVNWDDYLYLYYRYYHTSGIDVIDDLIDKMCDDILGNPELNIPGDPKLKPYILKVVDKKTARTRIMNAIKNISSIETDITFNASKSRTVIFYTTEQMRNILVNGRPEPNEKSSA